MFPLPSSLVATGMRRLWDNLGGEAAVRTSRLCIFAILIAMSIGGYWAVATRDHIERRLDDLAEQRRQYEHEVAALDASMARVAVVVEWTRTDQQRLGDDLNRLNARVARTEGQLTERGRRDQ